MRVAVFSGDAALAPALAMLLHGAPEVAARAEGVLVRMAAEHAGIHPRLTARGGADPGLASGGCRLPSDPSPGSGVGLEEALAAALRSIAEHARRGVALAAVVLLDTPRRIRWRRHDSGRSAGSVLTTALQGGAGLDAVRAALRTSSRPIARLRAWEWLGEATEGEGLLDRVRRAALPIEHELVLSRWHLSLHPRRMRALRRHAGVSRGKPTGILPPGWVVPRLSADARHGAAALAFADPARAAESLEPALGDGDELVRLASARVAPARLVADLCFDSDDRVARAAALRLSRVGVHVPGRSAALDVAAGTLPRLRRSPHESVRRLAVQEGRRVLGRGTGAEAGLALRMALRDDPEGALAGVRRLIRDGVLEERVAGLLAARRAGLGGALEGDLLQILASLSPPRLMATAATVLADCGSAASVAALRSVLDAPDARVRANALQSLGRVAARDRGGPASPVIGALASDPAPIDDHRARANLVRAMIEATPARDSVPCALHELGAMLADRRALHRLAGAWLAGRCLPGEGRRRLADGFVELSARVERLAEDDADPRVRARASACLRRLHAERRARWAGDGVLARLPLSDASGESMRA